MTKGQINFGTLNLGRNPQNGDMEFGFNQFANLFGFGGDNGFKVNTGEGRFGINGNQGGLLGGERVGTNSGINIDQNKGLNLGNPAGQLNTFINNVGHFFQRLAPPPVTPGLVPGIGGNFVSGVSQATTTEKSLTIAPELRKKFEEEDKENSAVFPTLVLEVPSITSSVVTTTTSSTDTDYLVDGGNVDSSVVESVDNNSNTDDKDLIKTSSNIDESVEVIEKPTTSRPKTKKRRGPPAPEGMTFIDDKDFAARKRMV